MSYPYPHPYQSWPGPYPPPAQGYPQMGYGAPPPHAYPPPGVHYGAPTVMSYPPPPSGAQNSTLTMGYSAGSINDSGRDLKNSQHISPNNSMGQYPPPQGPPPQTYGGPPAQYAHMGPPPMGAPGLGGPVMGQQYPNHQMPAPMYYTFQFKGVRLDRKDLFSKSDPFLIISASRFAGISKGKYGTKNKLKKKQKEKKKKINPGEKKKGGWIPIHKTETVMDDQNPVWRPFSLNLLQLCGGNIDTPFLIECFDWDPTGSHDMIGACEVTIRDLQVMKEVALVNRRRMGFSSHAGLLQVVKCSPAATA